MSVSISLVWPSSSVTAAGMPPGSRRVAHSPSVSAEDERVAIYATPEKLRSLANARDDGHGPSLGAALGLGAVDDFGRRLRGGRRGAIARPEPVLGDHLADAGEGLHDGGGVSRSPEVERLAKSRNGKAFDRAGRRGQGGLELVAADVGIRLDLRDPFGLQVDEGLHALPGGRLLARHCEIDEFLRLLLGEARIGE